MRWGCAAFLAGVGIVLPLQTQSVNAQLSLHLYKYQYAAKFACGPVTPANSTLFEPGHYRTVINVHNPNRQSVPFVYKAALAGLHVDGSISPFVNDQTGPDAVQAFDCERFYALLNLPVMVNPIDGFLVIETDVQLDVVGYYTALTQQAGTSLTHTSIDVQKYPPRDISPKALCRANFKIDLSDPNNWLKNDGSKPVSVAPVGNWDTTRRWMSYGPSYTSTTAYVPVQEYSYELLFCSCGRGTATITNGSVRSDDDSVGAIGIATLFTTPTGTFGSFNASLYPAVTISNAGVSVAGQDSFVITVSNGGGATGLSVAGTLTLSGGYSGACRP
jgi:hypothetical protein